MIEELLKSLCKELSISPIPVRNKDGVYTLAFNDTIEIRMNDLNPGVGLMARVANCPTLKREDLFIYLMRANLLGQGTGGSRIGLDANEKVLTLSLGLPYEMNYKIFKERFEDFVNFILYWREEIAKFENQPILGR